MLYEVITVTQVRGDALTIRLLSTSTGGRSRSEGQLPDNDLSECELFGVSDRNNFV